MISQIVYVLRESNTLVTLVLSVSSKGFSCESSAGFHSCHHCHIDGNRGVGGTFYHNQTIPQQQPPGTNQQGCLRSDLGSHITDILFSSPPFIPFICFRLLFSSLMTGLSTSCLLAASIWTLNSLI